MAWLFGSGRRAPAGHSESKAARDRQIANLHERVPGLQIKSNDNSLYEIRIAAPPDGAMVMLRVFLPTKFPADRPGESFAFNKAEGPISCRLLPLYVYVAKSSRWYQKLRAGLVRRYRILSGNKGSAWVPAFAGTHARRHPCSPAPMLRIGKYTSAG